MTLAEVVAAHVSRTLEECGGNISQAARELGIRRQSLQRKLRKLARTAGALPAPRSSFTF